MNKRQVKLSEAEQRIIQQQEAATSDVRELKRWQAVRLYGNGQAMSAVVNVVGRSSRTIQRWVEAYQEHGLAGRERQEIERCAARRDRAALTTVSTGSTVEQ